MGRGGQPPNAIANRLEAFSTFAVQVCCASYVDTVLDQCLGDIERFSQFLNRHTGIQLVIKLFPRQESISTNAVGFCFKVFVVLTYAESRHDIAKG